jgi:hypothetical protein
MLAVEIISAAAGVQQVALGEDARALALGVEHHGGADLGRRHPLRGLAQRVVRSDGHHDAVHAIAYVHGASSARINRYELTPLGTLRSNA